MVPDHNRSSQVLEADLDMHSKNPWILDLDPLYVSQELVLAGYFRPHDPPTLVDTGGALDLLRQTER